MAFFGKRKKNILNILGSDQNTSLFFNSFEFNLLCKSRRHPDCLMKGTANSYLCFKSEESLADHSSSSFCCNSQYAHQQAHLVIKPF